MNKVKVCFEYDEASRLWEVSVSGVVSELEAKQAFNAVVITAGEATPRVDCNEAEKMPDGSYHISVGI